MEKNQKLKMAGIFAIGAAVIMYGIFLLFKGEKKEEPTEQPGQPNPETSQELKPVQS